MSGRIDFTMDFKPQAESRTRTPDSRYRIYLLGHFSGRDDVPWPQRKIYRIDRDNFEQVMAEVKPRVEIDAGTVLHFSTPDDFHPDAWLHKINIIAELQALKAQLLTPDSAARAAAKIQAFLPTAAATPQPPAIEESQDDLLLRLLGKTSANPPEQVDSVQRLLHEAVAPHVSQATLPQHQQLIQVIDDATGQFARAILHAPNFQALEALWRATEALLHDEAAERHEVYLLDIGQAELTAELKLDAQTFTQKLLQHRQKADAEQEVLLVGDFRFAAGADDDALLAYCANLATACGGRFLAAVEQTFLQRLSEAGIKQQADSARLTLAYPGYLVRLPYGKQRDPLETLAFEECTAIPQAGELLWGNPAFLAARSILRIAEEQPVAEALFFGDTPAFSFDQDGESTLQPAVETVLTEAQAHGLLALGILPLIGYHQRRGIRLLGASFLDE